MPKKDFNGTIFVRCDEATTGILLDLEAKQGVHPQELARRLIDAACQLFRERRKIEFPIMVIPAKELQLAAESPGDYTAKDLISPADAIIQPPAKPHTAPPAGPSDAGPTPPAGGRAGRRPKAKR